MQGNFRTLVVCTTIALAGCSTSAINQPAERYFETQQRLGYIPHTIRCRPSQPFGVATGLANWKKVPKGTSTEWKMFIADSKKIKEYQREARSDGFRRLLSKSQFKKKDTGELIYCELYGR